MSWKTFMSAALLEWTDLFKVDERRQILHYMSILCLLTHFSCSMSLKVLTLNFNSYKAQVCYLAFILILTQVSLDTDRFVRWRSNCHGDAEIPVCVKSQAKCRFSCHKIWLHRGFSWLRSELIKHHCWSLLLVTWSNYFALSFVSQELAALNQQWPEL